MLGCTFEDLAGQITLRHIVEVIDKNIVIKVVNADTGKLEYVGIPKRIAEFNDWRIKKILPIDNKLFLYIAK